MSEIENLKIGNGGTLHIVGNEDIIANEWEAGQVYIENRSYVIREHKLLMCNTTHTSVEPFDPDKWTEKNIGEALGTAGSANMIECTLAEYNAWKAGGQLINETVYVITDAPNLNATAQDISYEGGADTVWDKVDGILHPVKIWSGSKYTLNDYIDIPDFDKDTIYMFEFMAFSGTYHTCFVSPVGDGYLQFVIWGDNTQHCRYRVQINTNSGRLTIVDVMNGGANQALVAIYSII